MTKCKHCDGHVNSQLDLAGGGGDITLPDPESVEHCDACDNTGFEREPPMTTPKCPLCGRVMQRHHSTHIGVRWTCSAELFSECGLRGALTLDEIHRLTPLTDEQIAAGLYQVLDDFTDSIRINVDPAPLVEGYVDKFRRHAASLNPEPTEEQ